MKTRSEPPASGLSHHRPTLVVGASGQLGTRIVQQLSAARRPVRALVRKTSLQQHLRLPHVDIVHADLADAASLDTACRGIGSVIATANAAAPLHGSRFSTVDDAGYAALIAACVKHRAERFVLVSAAQTPFDAKVPLLRHKRLTEQRLADSGLPHAVLRFAPFMDTWFALAGLALATRGDPAPVTARAWPFLQRFMGVVGGVVEQRGLLIVPGSAELRQAFIAVDDVARCCVAALRHEAALAALAGPLALGGPEALSWREVAERMAAVLQRPVQVVGTPAAVFALQKTLMRPFSEAAANIMALNWMAAQPLPPESPQAAARLGLGSLTSVDRFLRAQAAKPV
jgi:uncharacterized protein YbjT (DUF2867 family)